QHPDGVAGRYLTEGRLLGEVKRSASKFQASALPLFEGWKASEPKAPILLSSEILEDELGNGIEKPELDELDDIEETRSDSKLPPLFAHGDLNLQPSKRWLIKHLIPSVGHGLLSGQWGTGKTFVVFDLAASAWSGQPFLGHPVKRQCGVLLIAAE